MAVSSRVTTNLFEPELASSCGAFEVSPPNDAVSEYVAAGSLGVMEQDATPLAFVIAVQDCVEFSVSVTGSPAIPAPVSLLVSTAETVPASAKSLVPALTVSVVGVWTVAVEPVLEDW